MKRIVSIFVIIAFLTLDISQGYALNDIVSSETLAPGVMSAQELMGSDMVQIKGTIDLERGLIGSILAIAKYLLGDPEKDKGPLPINYMKRVLSDYLKPMDKYVDSYNIQKIDDDRVLIQYKKDRVIHHIYVARKDALSEEQLSGYEYIGSDTYVVKRFSSKESSFAPQNPDGNKENADIDEKADNGAEKQPLHNFAARDGIIWGLSFLGLSLLSFVGTMFCLSPDLFYMLIKGLLILISAYPLLPTVSAYSLFVAIPAYSFLAAVTAYLLWSAVRFLLIGNELNNIFFNSTSLWDTWNATVARNNKNWDDVHKYLPTYVRNLIWLHEGFPSHSWGMVGMMPGITHSKFFWRVIMMRYMKKGGKELIMGILEGLSLSDEERQKIESMIADIDQIAGEIKKSDVQETDSKEIGQDKKDGNAKRRKYLRYEIIKEIKASYKKKRSIREDRKDKRAKLKKKSYKLFNKVIEFAERERTYDDHERLMRKRETKVKKKRSKTVEPTKQETGKEYSHIGPGFEPRDGMISSGIFLALSVLTISFYRSGYMHPYPIINYALIIFAIYLAGTSLNFFWLGARSHDVLRRHGVPANGAWNRKILHRRYNDGTAESFLPENIKHRIWLYTGFPLRFWGIIGDMPFINHSKYLWRRNMMRRMKKGGKDLIMGILQGLSLSDEEKQEIESMIADIEQIAEEIKKSEVQETDSEEIDQDKEVGESKRRKYLRYGIIKEITDNVKDKWRNRADRKDKRDNLEKAFHKLFDKVIEFAERERTYDDYKTLMRKRGKEEKPSKKAIPQKGTRGKKKQDIYINNTSREIKDRRHEIVKTANKVLGKIEVSKAESFLERVGEDDITLYVKEKVQDIIDTVKNIVDNRANKTAAMDLPENIISEIKYLEDNIRYLEIDSIIASLILLARRAENKGQSLIIGFETDWIPGYEKGLNQHNAINPVVTQLERLEGKLHALGFKNVVLKRKKSGELGEFLLKEAQDRNTSLSNVIAIASKEVIASDSFKPLREAEDKPFLTEIDASRLWKFYNVNGEDIEKQTIIELIKIITLTMELFSSKEMYDCPADITYIKEKRKLIFCPDAVRCDYEKYRDENRASANTLESA